MRPELEVRDDSEIAAATSKCPEQVRVLLGSRAQDVAVGGDDLRSEQGVYGEPAVAAQPSHPTAEGEPTDAGVTHEAGRHSQPVSLRRSVHVAQQGSSSDLDAPRSPDRP